MLYARCVSMAINNMWADVLGGFYSSEEMTDSITEKSIKVVKEVEETKTEEKPVINLDDELPESFNKPFTNDLRERLLDAIDGEDWAYVGAHIITTNCSFKNKTVAEAVGEARQKVFLCLNRFDSLDKLAIEMYLEATKEKEHETVNI